ncbi:MAG: hypothetical protein IPK02_17290 [Candidatus Accumulibacter sp.]|uniref:YeeE/YedE family protein n=1 Tax=Candidatus Accumulibacter affinis TaxID=2954384 RepID=A0A935W624_9PROT|nr:hypothetical protein [Candidatus Accumulibacter affinis]
MKLLTAFISGTLFGLGLILAGMTDPLKVLAFLDVTGRWDPSLALVMIGAIGCAAVGFAYAGKRRRTLPDDDLQLSTRREINAPLIVGSTLFGIGWGLAGYCPGPGVVGLWAGSLPAAVFVIALFFGLEAHAWYDQERRQDDADEAVADS